MKILHTADWHVGRTIRGQSREDEHRAVLSEIAALAAGENVDLILVTGDIFDASTPSPSAEEIVYRALLALAEVGPVVIVAGNHDNPSRLRAVAPLLKLGRVRVGAGVERAGVLEFADLSTRVVMVPFISKKGIVRAEQILSLDSTELRGEYSERVQQIIAKLCAGMAADAVNILAGHLMVHGGQTGGGERAVHLFEYAIPTASFPSHFQYIALGHLHRPQRVAAPMPLWYSGSPLQLDFGEGEDRKAVLLVTAEPGLPAQVETRYLESGRRLRTLRGKLDQIRDLEVGDAFLRIDLDEPLRVGLLDEVRELFPNAVDIRLLSSTRTGGGTAPARIGRPPSELFADYLTGRGIDDDRLSALFAELVAEAQEPVG
ncbi:MAG TPA: exonuclease SbcCD subunit D [Acidimicrobiia bacterium]